MLIERFIDNPRHIEIQVIADKHGSVLYLPERECSIQRRNQKVLEEAPSTFIDAETRRAMGEQAVALARAVDYSSAGTVEMLVDSQRNFYFLEMNTRLQVEHPITELITGQDLVRHMIEVAANRPLSITQADVATPRGWATEARIYAEDPLRNFLPSIGRLHTYREPSGKDVRVDSGITEGSEISMYYDPLISKLVTYGADRQQSIATMRKALDTYVIRGVQHNIPFLRSMMDHPRYVSGDITTKFIEEEFPEGFEGHRLNAAYRRQLTIAAAVMHFQRRLRDADLTEQTESYTFPDEETYYVTVPTSASATAAEQSEPEVRRCRVQDYGYGTLMVEVCDEATGTVEQIPVGSEWAPGQPLFEAVVGDADEVLPEDEEEERDVQADMMRRLEQEQAEGISLEEQAERWREAEEAEELADELNVQLLESQSNGYRLQVCGNVYQVDVRTARQQELSVHMPEKVPLDTSNLILSPMPGTLISLSVKEGDTVTEGQQVAIMEAMKMQNVLRAERSGVIKKLHCEPGAQLQVDETIIEFEE
jgi:propionyl-CoA carboxylase alpha subunit